METKIKINSIFGKLLFEYECDENSIKKTVEQAVREKTDLSGSDLRNSNLRNSNLRNSDLSGSDLSSSDLSGSDLSSSDLRNSNLRNSNLSGSDLSGSDLSGSNLRNSNLSGSDLSGSNLSGSDLRNSNLSGSDLSGSKNKETAMFPIFCKWNASIIGDEIKIGCKQMTIEDWDVFFESSEEFDTKRNTDDFKQIQAVYLAYKSYVTFLK